MICRYLSRIGTEMENIDNPETLLREIFGTAYLDGDVDVIWIVQNFHLLLMRESDWPQKDWLMKRGC